MEATVINLIELYLYNAMTTDNGTEQLCRNLDVDLDS